MGDLDLKGTIKMINEIYSSLIESGSICKLLLNRVSGYCTPSHTNDVREFETNVESEYGQKVTKMVNDTISGSIKVGKLAEIPCYCDIQFKEREYLTVNELPDHPFPKNWMNSLKKSRYMLKFDFFLFSININNIV